MPKPCEGRHPGYADGCRLCWLARFDSRYMRLWGIEGEASPIPAGSEFKPARSRESVPCAHLGEAVDGHSRERLGLTHLRDWRRCELGHGEQDIVCTCFAFPRGCKGCPDYQMTREEPGP